MPEKHYYLYHLRLTEKYKEPANWTPEDEDIILRHAQFLDRLGREGQLVFAGRNDYAPGHPRLFGIALILAESLEEAVAMMAVDPAVQHGIQASEVHPFRMAIPHFGNVLQS
jgi:uncharacterized protein YciI